jgi:hypothetical protein
MDGMLRPKAGSTPALHEYPRLPSFESAPFIKISDKQNSWYFQAELIVGCEMFQTTSFMELAASRHE